MEADRTLGEACNPRRYRSAHSYGASVRRNIRL
jgi:hypothetical protein